ncbi:hypothetical protein MMC20_007263 [Loxospora ochrophaea]|nr:hypothetical protein [Loxospora ochrophaea]
METDGSQPPNEMSMPAWLSDVPAGPNNDNGTFNPSVDPTFMHTPTSASFDYNPLQHQQFQRMQAGGMRNGSPAAHSSIYQTQSVVPSKRPRPREDILGASPHQSLGTLPASRSHTPQQVPYPGFNGSVNGGQQISAPNTYQHLQHVGSSNASPSPIMGDQHFNPQAIPQRMQTVSPSPFSPAAQNFGSQASPPQSDYGGRVDTPQNGAPSYPQNMNYNGGSNQHFSPPPHNTSSGPHSGLPSQFTNIQQQRMYQEMRQRQMAQQSLNNTSQHRHQPSAMNPNVSSMSSNQMANIQQARAQQMQQSRNLAQLKSISDFMQQRGLPFNPNVAVGGRPLNPMLLWAAVVKLNGSKRVTAMNQWPAVAGMLQIPPAQFPSAPQELQHYWHSNLAPYESFCLQAQQQRRAVNSQMQASNQHQNGDLVNMHDQFSPVKQFPPQPQDQQAHFLQARQQQQPEFQTPVKQPTPQHDMRHPQVNGYSNSQQPSAPIPQPNTYSLGQSASTFPQVTPPQAQRPVTSSHPTSTRKDSYAVSAHTPSSHPDPATAMPRKAPIGPHFLPKFQPLEEGKGVETHGGIQVSSLKDTIDGLVHYRPDHPTVRELGAIDIRALTMSLRSGIHSEVRLALDTIASLSIEQYSPSLDNCEDLVETLIECAEEQVELLAENTIEVSEDMLISSYEEIVRGCRGEVESLQDVFEFGSLDYDLDRCVERVICITTILRNFSFFEANHPMLAEPFVLKFMTTVIRYLGTRNMLLRTYKNTLDFFKDIVIYLSNLSHAIDLPGKEDASCVLHFLLSFAPSPPPTVSGEGNVMFSPYDPSLHRYLPPAVDSLAKLLARDDPNRAFYKSIFAADSVSTPAYDLLSRTFALAIAPIPEHTKASPHAVVEIRKPYLAQGLLAAEILVTLIPASEHALPRSWLSSEDGFALSLLRLVSLLGVEHPAVPQRDRSTGRIIDPDPHAHNMITNRGIAVLRKLLEKAKDVDASSAGIPASVIPRKEIMLRAMSTSVDTNVVRQLCAMMGLEV